MKGNYSLCTIARDDSYDIVGQSLPNIKRILRPVNDINAVQRLFLSVLPRVANFLLRELISTGDSRTFCIWKFQSDQVLATFHQNKVWIVRLFLCRFPSRMRTYAKQVLPAQQKFASATPILSLTITSLAAALSRLTFPEMNP